MIAHRDVENDERLSRAHTTEAARFYDPNKEFTSTTYDFGEEVFKCYCLSFNLMEKNEASNFSTIE